MKTSDAKTKRRRVNEHIVADTYRLYGPIPDAIEYLREILAEHPNAELAEHWTGYESMEMQFQWDRPETDEEMAARLADEAARKEREAQEVKEAIARAERRSQYEKLKREFG